MMTVQLNGLPMGPSVNQMYSNNTGRGRLGRRKSSAYTSYTNQMVWWARRNAHVLEYARNQMLEAQGQLFQVHFKFNWHTDTLFTQKGKPKKIDTSNYIKAVEDAVSQMLAVDDCYFWRVVSEKIMLQDDKLPAFVDVVITPLNNANLSDLD